MNSGRPDTSLWGPGKAMFDDVYNLSDPAAYWQRLAPLDYQTPEIAAGFYRSLLGSLAVARGRGSLKLIDLCSGYGALPMMLNHDLQPGTLHRLYTDPKRAAQPDDAGRIAYDRNMLQRRKAAAQHRIAGVDVADNALHYSRTVGLIERAFVEDLENDAPSAELARWAADTDVIVEAGGMGYVGEATISKLISAAEDGRKPWVLSMPVRTVDTHALEEMLADHGYAVEHSSKTFRHRRFHDQSEQTAALDRLADFGIDTGGAEIDGFYRARLLVARPTAEAAAWPIQALLPAA